MKKVLLFLMLPLAALAMPCFLRAQSVAINADSSAADPSAILDLKSTIKGFLAPRMTMAQRNGIVAPAVGLLVYQTDGTAGYYCYNGTGWNPLATSGVGSDTSTGKGGNYWNLKDSNIYNNNHGHVGIGTDTAQEPLTVQTGDFERGFSQRGANNKVLTSFMGDNWAEFATVSNTDLYLGAGGFPHVVLNAATGNVGINTLTPANKLQINDPGSAFTGRYFAFGDGTNGSSFDVNSTNAIWESSSNITLKPKDGGSVGVSTAESGLNRFQVGDMGGTGYKGNDVAFGSQGNATGLAQQANQLQVASTTDIVFEPRNGTGFVGINCATPFYNRLQIGNPVDLSGYDIAFGNGNQASALAHTTTALQLVSNVDIALLPQLSMHNGRVGINTDAPQAPLEVDGYYTVPYRSSIYSALGYSTFDDDLSKWYITNVPGVVPNISILASNNVYAHEFDAYSDLRIKNLIGSSDVRKDLTTVNSIRIRDYTMKDKLQYGERRFKKVIAQELEKVDPDLVSKHTDFIPNVYQFTDSVTKVANGFRLHFQHDHHLGDSARKLKALIAETGSLQAFDIVAILSAQDVVISAANITTNHVFVYGEQVSDFRTVDYEGLTTLNISATQALNKEVEDLKKALAAANENIRILAHAVRELSKPVVGNRLAVRRYTVRR